MKILLSALCLCLPLCMQAQNNNLDYKYALKLYNLTTLTQRKVVFSDSLYQREASYNNYAHAAPALQIAGKKGSFHEIELSDLLISRKEDLASRVYPGLVANTSGAVSTTTSIALRYEYIWMLGKKKNSSVVPAIGFAASPYFTKFSIDPLVTSFYPTKDVYTGVRAFIVPRLNIFFNKRLFIDVNIPVALFDTWYQSSSTASGILPSSERKLTSFNVEAIPYFLSFRIGAGIKL